MNGLPRNNAFGVLAATTFVFLGTNGASAAVTFAASGGDLVVTIDSPIHFLITVGASSTQFALNFENVYTTGSSGHHGDVPSSGSSMLTLPGGAVSDGLDTWSDLGMTIGVLDPTDFYATFYFNAEQTLQAGDSVTVSAGTVTIEDFITRGGAVPDRAVGSILLIDESLSGLSAPVAVPESPVALIGGLGLLGLLRRRR